MLRGVFWIVSLVGAVCANVTAAPSQPWVGVHVTVNGGRDLDKLRTSIPALGNMGVNALVMEVDYSFAFASHPELASSGAITATQARDFAELCRANGIRPIPCLNCLGHQSWASRTLPLLAKHPELDETPGKYPNNQGIYCRSWCPLNPDVNRTVFPLIDELIHAFGADAFHVGMDEVFILADADCPRCKNKNPAELFAKQVNDLHEHLVKQKKVQMLMWGDRLLDAQALGYSKWEASTNGTSAAIDQIPRDIIICDWHYEKQAEYKSVPLLLKKGFRLWPAGWHDVSAAEKLMDFSLAQHGPRMLGYLSTTWGEAKLDELSTFLPTKLAVEKFGRRNSEWRDMRSRRDHFFRFFFFPLLPLRDCFLLRRRPSSASFWAVPGP